MASGDSQSSVSRAETEPLQSSRELLRAVKTNGETDSHESALAALPESALESMAHEAALAFWLNVYNAAAQLLVQREPELYESRLRFFRAEAVTVADEALTLDDVEHGLLRGKSKYGLGYVPRLLRSGFERRHTLADPDPRIHFALNCAAASCPPILAYSADVDAELDLAARGYLDATVEYDADADRVAVPRVCQWFRGDFGGPAGVRDMLREYEVIPADAEPSVDYLDWNWSRDTMAFAER
jgi:hypothetical protein